MCLCVRVRACARTCMCVCVSVHAPVCAYVHKCVCMCEGAELLVKGHAVPGNLVSPDEWFLRVLQLQCDTRRHSWPCFLDPHRREEENAPWRVPGVE